MTGLSNLRSPTTTQGGVMPRQAFILRAADLVCFTDMMVDSAPIIPLGVLIEVNVSHLRAFAFLARLRINRTEHDFLSPMLAKIIENPSKFWRSRIHNIFDDMRDNHAKRGQLINELAKNSMNSLVPQNAEYLDVPENWRHSEFEKIDDEVSSFLRRTAKQRMVKLMNLRSMQSGQDEDIEVRTAA